MMRTNLIGLFAAMTLALAAMIGCEQKSATSSSSTQPTTGATTQAAKKPDGSQIVVAYSQIGAESGWRTAETKSIQDEAARRGIKLLFSDAQQKQENQIRALRAFIAQRPDVIMLSPVVETGWEPVLRDIKRAGIPVIMVDRRADTTDDSLYATFIGSDFVKEGHSAGAWLAKATDGKATIVELEGTTGAAPANDRKKGFDDEIAKHPGMKIIYSQTGDFTRQGGKQVMEAFLKTPEAKSVTALFAHNDEMALGAIQAMEEQGIKPGKDIKIVSCDGVRGIFEAMVAGKANCTVECNPLLGPACFDAVQKLVDHQPIPRHITVEEGVFTQDQAAAALPNRKY
jgi:simple sugar transport system substrate-binding protein